MNGTSKKNPQSRKSHRGATSNNASSSQSTSVYFLKLVLYIILGSFWLRFAHPINLGIFELRALPIGLFIGLMFARHEHFMIDRKIELAVLLIVAIMSLFLNTGIIL